MNKLMKIIFGLSAFLFFIAAQNSFSQSAVQRMNDAGTRVDRLEVKPDQIRGSDKDAKKATEDMRENQADRLEDRADQVRGTVEDKADRMENKADRVRDGH